MGLRRRAMIGANVNIDKRFYIFKDGFEYPEVTGGFNYVHTYDFVARNSGEYIEFIVGSQQYTEGYALTKSKIDLSRYSKLYIEYEFHQDDESAAQGYLKIGQTASTPTASGSTQITSNYTNKNKDVYEYALNAGEENYIYFYGRAHYRRNYSLKIYSVWFE